MLNSEINPTLRDREEIQRAHDLLSGLLEMENPALPFDTRSMIHASADVLCWVLQHDHNTAFTENLQQLEAQAEEVGFELQRAIAE